MHVLVGMLISTFEKARVLEEYIEYEKRLSTQRTAEIKGLIDDFLKEKMLNYFSLNTLPSITGFYLGLRIAFSHPLPRDSFCSRLVMPSLLFYGFP